MYYLAVRQFVKVLKNLDTILDKATKHAQTRNFDVNNFVSERLHPDMLSFASQIRIACDMAKVAAASLASKQPPVHEDTETTMEELRGRIGKCVTYLETFTAADFDKVSPETVIKVANPKGKGLRAEEFLLGRAMPNFYFHVVTAYNLLRAGGVEVGKMDYLGTFNHVDTL